jgi:hypothetical protein
VVREVLRALIVTAAVLSVPPAAWAGGRPTGAAKDTPDAGTDWPAEVCLVIVGSAVLVLGVIRWGHDITAQLRKLRGAPAPPWREPSKVEAPASPAWTYHPPPEPAEPPPEAAAGKGASDTVRIRKLRQP